MVRFEHSYQLKPHHSFVYALYLFPFWKTVCCFEIINLRSVQGRNSVAFWVTRCYFLLNIRYLGWRAECIELGCTKILAKIFFDTHRIRMDTRTHTCMFARIVANAYIFMKVFSYRCVCCNFINCEILFSTFFSAKIYGRLTLWLHLCNTNITMVVRLINWGGYYYLPFLPNMFISFHNRFQVNSQSFFMARQPYMGLGLLLVEVLRPHSDTPHSVRLLWTSDRSVAETSI